MSNYQSRSLPLGTRCLLKSKDHQLRQTYRMIYSSILAPLLGLGVFIARVAPVMPFPTHANNQDTFMTSQTRFLAG